MKKLDTFIRLTDLGFQGNQIKFIDKEDHDLDQAIENILNSEVTGIDSEFRGPLTKLHYEPSKVALLQISTPTYAFLFDAVTLDKSEKFSLFLREYITSQKIMKVEFYNLNLQIGHTIGGDFEMINKTFGLGKIKAENVIDVKDVYYKKMK